MRRHRHRHRRASLVVAVATLALVGGWMVIDGARALMVGDYATPTSGAHAGQLGPWAALVGSLGIAPRSTGMKTWFVLQGAVTLAAAGAFTWRPARFRTHALVAGLALAWYLPFGTLAAAVVALALGARRA